MHLKDAKTGTKATKIRILQMPHAGDNITEGYALRATPPATRLRLASALLLSDAPRCHFPQQERRSERTNARAKRVARSRGLSEAQPSVTGLHTIMHLKDANITNIVRKSVKTPPRHHSLGEADNHSRYKHFSQKHILKRVPRAKLEAPQCINYVLLSFFLEVLTCIPP